MLAAMTGCAAGQPEAETTGAAMLEYPGLHWNDTPEQVIAQLGLTEDQIIANDSMEDTAYASQWVLAAENVDFMGYNLTHVEFSFIGFYDEPCGLTSIIGCFGEDEDMDAVRSSLVSYYGPYTETHPESYIIHDNKLESSSEMNEGVISRAEDGHVLQPSQTAVYWAAMPDGQITKDMREEMYRMHEEVYGVSDHEMVDQYLDLNPLARITCDEHFIPYLYTSFSFFTGNFVKLDGAQWVMLEQLS